MSTLWESVRLAMRTILRSGVRSTLTVLGVLIGIAAVAIVVALGESARKQVSDQIESLGSNLVYVFNGPPGGRMRARQGRRLSAADARAIREQVGGLKGVTVYASLQTQVKSAFDSDRVDVVGATEDYTLVRAYHLLAGRDLSPEEVRAKSKVALIGQTARKKLFGDLDPVGHAVTIAKHRFEVVGVLSEKGPSPFGSDQDDRLVIPIGTWQTLVSATNGDRVDMVVASAVEADEIEDIKSRLDELLRERHRIAKDGQADFNLVTQDQFRQSQDEVYRVLSLLLISVAAVSLFVGGVGVMNILLVGVTERRREIGTRLALGAKARDIRLQFLTEAVALTLMGGTLGLLLSLGLVELLRRRLEWPLELNLQAVSTALSTSVGIGIVFGLWPAHRASRLDPIAALRYE